MKLRNPARKGKDSRYFLFSGKGGVGKTSIAAATAVHLSDSGKKVLLISTDPAHSLSDAFETSVGGEIIKLQKNLFAVEIDPEKAIVEYKEKFMSGMQKIEALQGLGLGETFDMIGMTPGIDEFAALDKFMQYMQSREYDVIIFDTAPTGHTLRLLSLPDVLDSWVGKMIMLRTKLSGMMNMVKKILPFSEEDEDADMGMKKLEEIKERIKEAKEILTDPKRTRYSLVMIPEEMSILESERSLLFLEKYDIPARTVIINQVIPESSGCAFCREKRKQQQERLKTIGEKFRGMDVLEVPLHVKEVKGFGALRRLGKEIFKNKGIFGKSNK